MQGRVVLGRYEVLQHLGHGSMGQVWLARDRLELRPAVVKFMSEGAAARPRFRDQFRQEMQLMAAFRHPHAVALYDASPDVPCLVMEFVPGVALDRVLNHRRLLVPDDVGDLLIPLCQALHAAHKAGIIHRDLKPANVMVAGPDRPAEGVKVMDLGLAALQSKPHISLEQLQGSDERYATGTPAYVCPEQLRGDPSDHRGDIYSLGVTLFELLTGRLPFEDHDTQALLRAHAYRPPPSFREAGMGILPPAVEKLVQLCLAKYPNERPQSAYEVACRFQAALGRDVKLDERSFQPVSSPKPAAAPARGPAPAAAAHRRTNPAADTEQVVERLEAWMPEPIAAVKIRGFVGDAGGTVVASEPGLIRVRFDPPQQPQPRKSSVLGWLNGQSGPVPIPVAPIALDLHLVRAGSGQGRLVVTAAFRAAAGPLPNDPRWHRRCHDLVTRLKGYLMA
ncbi:MAG TPA: serine/threonine-protein kinase [Gemmataceae bacterium]|jgi:serine/threonine-protein kinase